MGRKRVPPYNMNDLAHFGHEVKEARVQRKLTQRQLGTGAGKYSESYVSKVEAGAILCSEEFARGCDLVFGSGGIFERLRERVTRRDHASWFQPYADLEGEASGILTYNGNLVPGLLQTEAYAEAVTRAQNPRMNEDDVRARVAARRDRRRILHRAHPPMVWAVLHETCLRTRIGGDAVMAAQLESLLEDSRLPNVTTQVLPFTITPPATEPFILLTMPNESTVAYAETAMTGQVSDNKQEVTRLVEAYDRLRAESLCTGESAALISTYIERYTP